MFVLIELRSGFGVESDHDLLAVGVAAKGPNTTASERSAGRKRVLHELQVRATAVVALGEHSEGAGDGLPEDGRPVGESPEHRSTGVRAEERLVNPDLKRIMPWAGTSRGPESIVRTFTDVSRFWEVVSFEPL
jgi:hypothetical protein